MKIIGRTGREEIAYVYLAETGRGEHIEFVESVQPPVPREEKWVLIVSTLYGCPVGCAICDAGGWYRGRLTSSEIMEQVDFMVNSRYPDRVVPARKFKIQFARMGEPSLNVHVLEVLEQLPERYNAPGLMPCLSTVAPNGSDRFFERLFEIKNELYPGGAFQMQFSLHTTDINLRDSLIPIKKWDFARIATYGERFFCGGDRKIALNFALAENAPLDIEILTKYFDPEIFLIKLTPVNPTVTAYKNKLNDGLAALMNDDNTVMSALKERFEVIISIGELEENGIGSNCGQYVRSFLDESGKVPGTFPKDIAYRYELADI